MQTVADLCRNLRSALTKRRHGIFQIRRDALGSLTVPQIGNPMTSAVCYFKSVKKGRRVGLHELIGPFGNRYGALRVGAQCEARDSQRGGLLLDSTGVGDDCSRIGHETEERVVR